MSHQPSRENGSAVMVAERLKVTLDDMKKAASPRNQQPWKGGPVLANAKPWGVPDVYEPVE